jgi:hypothetical protein
MLSADALEGGVIVLAVAAGSVAGRVWVVLLVLCLSPATHAAIGLAPAAGIATDTLPTGDPPTRPA